MLGQIVNGYETQSCKSSNTQARVNQLPPELRNVAESFKGNLESNQFQLLEVALNIEKPQKANGLRRMARNVKNLNGYTFKKRSLVLSSSKISSWLIERGDVCLLELNSAVAIKLSRLLWVFSRLETAS